MRLLYMRHIGLRANNHNSLYSFPVKITDIVLLEPTTKFSGMVSILTDSVSVLGCEVR